MHIVTSTSFIVFHSVFKKSHTEVSCIFTIEILLNRVII